MKEAQRLIAVRDALREAERRAVEREFQDDRRKELEREVVKVSAEELASWFEPESAPKGAAATKKKRKR